MRVYSGICGELLWIAAIRIHDPDIPVTACLGRIDYPAIRRVADITKGSGSERELSGLAGNAVGHHPDIRKQIGLHRNHAPRVSRQAETEIHPRVAGQPSRGAARIRDMPDLVRGFVALSARHQKAAAIGKPPDPSGPSPSLRRQRALASVFYANAHDAVVYVIGFAAAR